MTQYINAAIDDIDNTYLNGIAFYDYDAMRKRTNWLRQELQKYLFEPHRIFKWIASGRDIEEYLN